MGKRGFMAQENVKDILKQYEEKLKGRTGDDDFDTPLMSRDYETFRQEALENNVTFYERMCLVAEGILRVNPNKKDTEKLAESIDHAHLAITPQSAASFASFISFSIILIGIAIGGVTYALGEIFLFTALLFVFIGAILIKPLTHIPNYIATRWRLQASNQMVMCVLYMVIYMKHTSNLEHAVKFAGEHLGPPLGLDLKKVLWDIETEKHITIKESLDEYLGRWKDYNSEFVEALHLIEGSLYESKEERRVQQLEKALQITLDGTYDKMLHYAHNLQSPITILHMLGVILPILGLVMFPLVGSFLAGAIKWYHLAILYNIFLPIFVYAVGLNILNKRPTGYGEGEILKTNPQLKALTKAPGALFMACMIGFIFILIGLFPVITHYARPDYDAVFLNFKLLDYKGEFGPYGIGALFFSFFIPLGAALAISFYYKVKTKRLIEYKQKTDKLETEFSGVLFQLGNRIGDGLPTETAFSHVAQSLQGTSSGEFFTLVDTNLRQRNLNLQRSIFDPEQGALLYFPSKLIESTMKILVQSAKKGSAIASNSLITISNYIDRIRKVNERLKDLMADVLSSMTSQITFLTPIIAGIVVGVGSMIVTIVNLLGSQFEDVGALGDAGFGGGVSAIANIIRIQDVIPGYQFQIVVGVYVVEIAIILTVLSTLLERGIDTTTTRSRISKNVIKSVGLYVAVSCVGVILFNLLAQAVSVVSANAG